MIKLSCCCLFLVFVGSLQAQTPAPLQINGTVVDSAAKKAVPLATVDLLDSQSKSIAAATTDDAGRFTLGQLAPGNFTIKISSAGYVSTQLPVTLSRSKTVTNLGTILLHIDKQVLGAVTVTAQKDLIEDKGDRLVYNAEKDISNTGGTAAELLRKVPGLSVDISGNVRMRGNSNIKVLINGKPSAMMARNLADALRQMPASVIKSVEVITSPGAKYDAEGAAGVINIITKKGLQGLSGSINATAGNLNRGLGTTLNLKKKKIGLTLSANGYQYRDISENLRTRTAVSNGVPLNVLRQQSSGDNTGTGGYGEMSFDYDPDSTNHLNFAANVWGGIFPFNSSMDNKLSDASGNILEAYRNESRFKNPYGNSQFDLGYTKSFKKKDHEFSLLGQFSRMPDNYFYNTDRYEQDLITYRQLSNNYSRNKEYTLQADYTYPFSIRRKKDTADFKIETGAKAILRNIGSEYRVEESPDGHGSYQPDPSQSNDFRYKQQVSSLYASLRLDTKRKWSINAGARLEHTTIDGDFLTSQTKVKNQFNNLIPSFTLSKGIKLHKVKVSYTQRITRPMIWYLNPWVNESDPKNITTGNPFLNPELNHAVELSHNITTKKGLSANSAVYTRVTNNAIEYLAVVDAAGVSINKPQNIAQRKSVGLNVNLSGQPVKGWDLNGNADVSYVDLRSVATGQRNNGVVWNMNLNTTYKLPKEYTLAANGGYYSGWISLQNKNSAYYWYGMSVKHSFWKKKADLTLAVNNPFNRALTQRGVQSAPTFYAESYGTYVNRSVRLTFDWRFGQMKTDGVKKGKKISNDDKGR